MNNLASRRSFITLAKSLECVKHYGISQANCDVPHTISHRHYTTKGGDSTKGGDKQASKGGRARKHIQDVLQRYGLTLSNPIGHSGGLTKVSTGGRVRKHIKDTEIPQQYGLTEGDLEGLRYIALRNAYENEETLYPEKRLYLRADVATRALELYKTHENIDLQRRRYARAEEEEDDFNDARANLKEMLLPDKKQNNSASAMNHAHKKQQITSAQKAVWMSIKSNSLVAIAKFSGYLYTGSASMFSEAIHSVVDIMNQTFNAFGIIYSQKKPHSDHPYGFDKARYVYALISGVAIFEVGSLLTIKHGVTQLYHPTLVLDHSLSLAYAVLLFTVVFEGLSLTNAYHQAKKLSTSEGVTLRHYILKGYEPNTVGVLAEDSAGVAGVVIAGVCIGLSSYTGNPVYDALGSILVGTLLGGVSIFIVGRNYDALLGRAMDHTKQRSIVDLLESQSSVKTISDVKTIVEGPSCVRFKAEICFNADFITQSYLSHQDVSSLLKEARELQDEEQLEKFMKREGTVLGDTLALEIDNLERLIKRKCPEIRHVDLEADLGAPLS